MAAPPRHGLRTSNLPIPVSEQELREASPGLRLRQAPASPQQKALQQLRARDPRRGVPRAPSGAVPLTALDTFLDSLPHPGVQQVSLVDEVAWKAKSYTNGQVLSLNSGYIVPEQMVYVFTDIMFFALTPSSDLAGASEFLPQPALNGLIRFELLFNSVAPMQLESKLIVPATGNALGRRGGWPFTNRRFGVERSSGWAVYASANQEIQAKATIDQMPTFPITVLGVEFRGFSLPDVTFREKIIKDWRSRLPGQP